MKKITSLVMLWSMILMTYTGIMLFVAPQGRVAYWADWTLLGLSKSEYGDLHTTFMVIFIVATLLHIYYNWKPLTSYMKNRAKEMIIFTKEMVIAISVTTIFIIGTLTEVVPFSTFLQFGEDISDSWIDTYGEPPYGHAELSSLKIFSQKMGYDLKSVKNILDKNSIKYENINENLKDIAKKNGVSPSFIHQLIEKNINKDLKTLNSSKNIEHEFSGLGRKSLAEVATTLGYSSDEFLKKLKELGIEAKESDKFKTTAEAHNMSPIDIVEKVKK